MQLKREDVYSHNTGDSLWLIIENKVYDVTKFVKKHPGGAKVMSHSAGGDATVRVYAFRQTPHMLTNRFEALSI